MVKNRMRQHLLHIMFILLGILALEFVGKSFFLVSIYATLIVIGALMLAWAAESAEVMISEGLALAIVAWLQVLPEFTIEATIAWARDVPNLLANFTGANRILTGVGWPLVFFTAVFFYWVKNKRFYGELKLKPEHSVEVIFLLLSTIYFFFVYYKHAITLADSIVLGGIYILYLYVISKLPHASRKKAKGLYGGVSRRIMDLNVGKAKFVTVSLFLVGGLLIWIVAGPFYRGMLTLATTLGLSQFLFIQWVAPFLSEFPEKTSAFYWASKIKTAPVSMMNLISSKITQWTALIAMIPIVFSISSKSVSQISVSGMLSTELMLTIATSLFAAIFLMKLRINIIEASSLFILWLVQFIFVSLRTVLIFVYFGLTIIELIIYRKEVMNAVRGFINVLRDHVVHVKT